MNTADEFYYLGDRPVQFLRWYTLKSNQGHYLSVRHANEFDALKLAEHLLGIDDSFVRYTLSWKVENVIDRV